MDRAMALQTIRNARQARGVSYDDLAKAIGTKDATYLAAALHGQHRLREDEAKKLAAAVGVDVETALVTTAMPLRTEFPLTTDPFKYRLMELVGVYGDALRDQCQELFGDGILSALALLSVVRESGEPLASLTRTALDWIRRLRVEGAAWRVLPEPSVPELYPHARNTRDAPCESASIPDAPEPANRSHTIASGIWSARMLRLLRIRYSALFGT